MTFANIPEGATVFLDANPLIYHFVPDPVFGVACSDLLVRIKRQVIDGCTATHVLLAACGSPCSMADKRCLTSLINPECTGAKSA